MAAEGRILALGGWAPIAPFVLDLAGADRPTVTGLMTATGDHPGTIVRFYELFAETEARVRHAELFGIPRPDLREALLGSDVIFVAGGNTASMLAVWRAHGVDEVLREAWKAGALLCGWSAGAICWFEAGVTDSFRAQLDGIECLGWLPGSCCPHYDGEEQRRPAYHRLLRSGFPAGTAVDDACGLLYRGDRLAEVVAWRAGAGAYRVELADGEIRETALDVRLV